MWFLNDLTAIHQRGARDAPAKKRAAPKDCPIISNAHRAGDPTSASFQRTEHHARTKRHA